MQYGTVARMLVKPGKLEALQALTQGDDMVGVQGFVGTVVYQMDDDPNVLMLAVVFESKEAYVANAESPEQDARYHQFVELLEKAPEWHDGTVIFNAFAR